ncbi:hypothetical protein [Anaeromyxobacter oryzisoli]|uniref:hypothetical protein n=1 Tax=Anaeromyxobacter oryzisoli TaxID=2925408 RepID=UPI001F5A450A|nr:hypothetical protein [Anaeromyxobacter sp. SG63]
MRLATAATSRRTASRSAADRPSLGNLAACIADARAAALERDDGPADPADYRSLLARLEKARAKLPPLYRQATGDPFVATLEKLGARGFKDVLGQDPDRQGIARLMLDLAQAVLQNGEGYQELATDAFQEVVSDLYDGFVSAEDRRGVKPPDRGVVPPLVKWGSAADGPYTWPVAATASFQVQAPIVSLPAPNARAGLLAWSTVAHETAGHDLLAADDGLHDELAKAVREEVAAAKLGRAIADYWADRLDETASDVMGVLNMGPAAAAGLIGYFRALNGAYAGREVLRNVGPEDDPHPADIARGWLGAETVRLLSFSAAKPWADALAAETDRDLGQVRLGRTPVTAAVAKESAAVVARTVVRRKLESLERHALGDIQDWRDADEAIVRDLRQALRAAKPVPARFAPGTYAAHAVAAAVTEALSPKADVPGLTKQMIRALKVMHDANPSWGPLYVAHPGDLVASRVRGRTNREAAA